MIPIRIGAAFLVLLICFSSLGVQPRPAQADTHSDDSGNLHMDVDVFSARKVCVGTQIRILIQANTQNDVLAPLAEPVLTLSTTASAGNVDKPQIVIHKFFPGAITGRTVRYTATTPGKIQIVVKGELVDVGSDGKKVNPRVIELKPFNLEAIRCQYKLWASADLSQLNAELAAIGMEVSQSITMRGDLQINTADGTVNSIQGKMTGTSYVFAGQGCTFSSDTTVSAAAKVTGDLQAFQERNKLKLTVDLSPTGTKGTTIVCPNGPPVPHRPQSFGAITIELPDMNPDGDMVEVKVSFGDLTIPFAFEVHPKGAGE